MRVRRLVLALLSVLVLSGAMLSVVSAAPRTQDVGETARHERPAKAFLGLETTKLSPRIKQYLGLPEEVVGLLVMGSIPGSPAAASGTERADVVLSVDGLVLETPKNLARLVNSKAPGDVIEVHYVQTAREPPSASRSLTRQTTSHRGSPHGSRRFATLSVRSPTSSLPTWTCSVTMASSVCIPSRQRRSSQLMRPTSR